MADANDAFLRNQGANNVQARAKAQNRASVLQLKLMGQSHPTGLTPNLLRLFEPRPPLEFKIPPEKRKCLPYSGMAQFVSNFSEPGDPEYSPPVLKGETPAQKKARINKLRLEKGAEKIAKDFQTYDPSKDPNVTGDPYKTLFVARLNYETTEHRIKREFESYGPIKRVRLITDKETSKPRGYAFVEYMHTRDMKTAYKQADGRKLDNRRVIVDVERGRTVANWRPRKLGGGLGSTRVGGEDLNQKYSGREPQQIASGGASKSEEPRGRDSRHQDREREVSGERGREREREKSHDRSRDRNPREERHNHSHRDRDHRTRDRGERERDRGRDSGRDRIRDSHRDRDRGRDNDRDHHPREREQRDRERDYDRGSSDRGRGRDKLTTDFGSFEQKSYREQHGGDRDMDYDYGTIQHGGQEGFDDPSNISNHGRGHHIAVEYDQPQYVRGEIDRGVIKREYGEEDDRKVYDYMEEDGYQGHYDAKKKVAFDEYNLSRRSLSHEYDQ
ncbi:U1 small nuclear ribonucleoprotein 70 kDa [Zostera marina]|uniref:U1 small nuclear ribonucleoprotein 70 kDa n=1 Tax=Zostera marina TaxID=29655 RepID=A0A0K9NTB3_ZOSMR|nr:U1 small nuclear ribonucleoprotein 70 kDa [Zostera marina]